MTQDDLDLKYAAITLSKTVFFQTAKSLGLSSNSMLKQIQQKKNVSSEEADDILYDKACAYKKDITGKKAFLEYLIK